MTLNLTLSLWWALPLLITLLCFGWIAFWTYADFSGGGMFAGVGALIMSVPALLLTAVVWVIGALCK